MRAHSGRLISILAILALLGSTMACRVTERGADCPRSQAIGHLNVGIALLERHSPAKAEAEFRRALALDDGYVEAQVNLAVALAARFESTEALVEADRALEMDSENLTARYLRGILTTQMGRPEEALAAFEMVQTVDPDDADTNYQVATLYRNRGRRDLQRAARMLDTIVVANPTFTSAVYALSMTYTAMGATS